jgi:hypothetical protein
VLPTARSALAFSPEKPANRAAADSCRFRPHCGLSFPERDGGGARALNDRPTLSPIGGARGETTLAFLGKTPANRRTPDSRAVRSCFGAMFPERELPVGAAFTKRQ